MGWTMSKGRTSLGHNKEAPQQDAGESWFDGVLSSGCLYVPIVPCLPVSYSIAHFLSVAEQHVQFDLFDSLCQEVRLGDGVGGSKSHFLSHEGKEAGSVHAEQCPRTGSQRGGERVTGCARSRGVRTRPRARAAVTKLISGLAPLCSGWQLGTSH